MFSFFKNDKLDKEILELFDELKRVIKIINQKKADYQIDKNYSYELKKTIDEYFHLKNKEAASRMIEILLKLSLSIKDEGDGQKVKNSPSLISRLTVVIDLAFECLLDLLVKYKIEIDEKIRSAFNLFRIKDLELVGKRRALLEYLDIISDDESSKSSDKYDLNFHSSQSSISSRVDLELAFFDHLVSLNQAFYLDYNFEWKDFLSSIEMVIPGLKITSEVIEKNLFKVKFNFKGREIEKKIKFNPDDYLGENLKYFLNFVNQRLNELSIEKKFFEYSRSLGDSYMVFVLDNNQYNYNSTLILG